MELPQASGSKNYLLDTNTLLHDPQAIHVFEDNDVYILVTVLEELDKFKNEPGQLGANARRVARELDELRGRGKLNTGVEMESGGRLFVTPFKKNGLDLDFVKVDNQLLSTALKLKHDTNRPTILVTKDINLRVRADGHGIPAEDYLYDKSDQEKDYGVLRALVPRETIDALFKHDVVEIPDVPGMWTNRCMLLIDNTNPKHTAPAICVNDHSATPLVEGLHAMGIKPRNLEQQFAMHALLKDGIKAVTLRGRAGTGKTVLAIACAVQRAASASDEYYNGVVVTRPVVPIGNDIGYLPGDVDEKMAPWMGAIWDAMGVVKDRDQRSGNSVLPHKWDEENLSILPLIYVRGRSISNSYIIVDEAQNLTPHEVKTLATRVSQGSKIVFTGDVAQIDNPYLDQNTNGLSHLITRLSGESIFMHIDLTKGERSEFAELASKKL